MSNVLTFQLSALYELTLRAHGIMQAVLSLKLTVFRDVAPCSPVEIDRRFRGACCLHHQGDVEMLSLFRVCRCIVLSLYQAAR
jgi:hypothetical protein